MTTHRVNYDNNIRRTIFTVLFFLFVFLCAFAFNPDHHTIRDDQQKIIYSLSLQLSALNNAQLFPDTKDIIPVVVKSNFKPSSDCYKIVSDNRLVHHRIQFLQRTELMIKPVLLNRFLYQCHYNDTDDFPDLS